MNHLAATLWPARMPPGRGGGQLDNLRLSVAVVTAAALLAQLGLIAVPSAQPPAVTPDPRPFAARPATSPSLAGAMPPLRFEPNVGQTDRKVEFLSKGAGYNLWLTKNEAVLAITETPEGTIGRRGTGAGRASRSNVLRMRLQGGTPDPTVKGFGILPGTSNYFLGPRSDWMTDVPNYRGVRYGSVYPGIDLVYRGETGHIAYDFHVAPGADPNWISMAFSGSDRPHLNEKRDLVLETHAGTLVQDKPFIYQEINSEIVEIEGRYVLGRGNRVGFSVDSYDHNKELVIDPPLVYSTFLGGSGRDEAGGIAVDSAGAAYIVGTTGSYDFPTRSPYQSVNKSKPLCGTSQLPGPGRPLGGGPCEVFVTKLNPSGSDLVYSTYLGGEETDEGLDIAVDSGGSAYVTGVSFSKLFPTTLTAYGHPVGGGWSAFFSKLSPDGSELEYSTVFGGFMSDPSIAIDPAGDAYIASTTKSPSAPTTDSAYDRSWNGGSKDILVAKFDPQASGTASLVYSTYVGGSGKDQASDVAIDSSGVYVSGSTESDNFPVARPVQGGNERSCPPDPDISCDASDAFIAKLTDEGSALDFSTYLGGTLPDEARAIAVEGDNAYVTGATISNDFPLATHAFGDRDGSDAFVSSLDIAQSTLNYSTYLGGNGLDEGVSVAVDGQGSAYVAGTTGSDDFPVTSGSYDELFNDGGDVFFAKVSPGGSALEYSTYLGGSGTEGELYGADLLAGFDLDGSGNAYIAGSTAGGTFPTTEGAFDRTNTGADAFIVKLPVAPTNSPIAIPAIAHEPAPPPRPVVEEVSPRGGSTVRPTRLTIKGTGFSAASVVQIGQLFGSDVNVISSAKMQVTAPPQPQGSVDVIVTTAGGRSDTSPATRFTYGEGGWRSCDGQSGPMPCSGSLGGARYGHTSTLLDGSECRRHPTPEYCGKVLVAGFAGWFSGFDNDLPRAITDLQASELYDPAAGEWNTTGLPDAERTDHTATLLDGPDCRDVDPLPLCGGVLITGGLNRDLNRGAMASTEMYDPSSAQWLPTAPLATGRFAHTATLLDGPECGGPSPPDYCGRVLAVGGTSNEVGRVPLDSVEVYDPVAGVWLPASPLLTPRTDHTATLLEDGRVLVAGGIGPQEEGTNGQAILSSAEIYDPETDSWMAVDDMGVERFIHEATLIEKQPCGAICGHVLVTGGIRRLTTSPPSPPVVLASAELFDPATGTWRPTGGMNVARIGHSATQLNRGDVLAVGGGVPANDLDAAIGLIESAEIFDAVTERWTYTASPDSSHSSHSATLLDGPACRTSTPAAYCGSVVVAGAPKRSGTFPPATRAAGLYVPAPEVTAVAPRGGRFDAYTQVVISGNGFVGVERVLFGSAPAVDVKVDSPTQITATAPPTADRATVTVAVENPGGTSAKITPDPAANFSYVGDLGTVVDLVSRVSSEEAIALSFSAVGYEEGPEDMPIVDYVVKQSRTPINAENFGQASSLCGGVCHFEPADPSKPLKVGSPLTQEVQGLSPGTTYYFAVQPKSNDSYGEVSDDVEVRTLGDPPVHGEEVEEASGMLSAVDDLAASSKSARDIDLSFSAVGDGNTGGASRYLIKQATEPITEESFTSAKSLCGGVCSFDVVDEGDKVSLAVKDLKASTTYYYAVKALGEGDQQGPMSNGASATTEPDTIAPEAVGDLAAQPLSGAEIKLSFSAPASDAGEGPPVTDYLIKQAREPITEANFESAKTLCEGTCEFTPAAAGEQLSLSVTGLESSSTYHYALKAIDEGDNSSGLSNLAFATTSEVTPGKVTGLEATAKSMSKIALGFSAADDGTGEAASSYVIKQSKRAMRSEDGFSKAQTLCGGSCRFEATEIGQRLRLAVTGLDPDTTYHYAIRALDDSGENLGARSPSVKATTRPDRIDPGKVDDLRAKALSKTAVKLLFSAVASNRSKGPAVTTYIIKQSRRPIKNGRDFRRAQKLCGRVCSFDAAKVGGRLNLKITELSPATTYYFAVVAKDAGGNSGPRSKTARARTSGR